MTALSKNFPQKRRKTRLVEFVFRIRDHGFVKLCLNPWCPAHGDAVQFQKQQCGTDFSAFVTVKETLRFGNVKGVGRRDIKLIAVRIKKRVVRGCQCGVELAGLTQASGSSITFQRLFVKSNNFTDFQKIKHLSDLFCKFAEQRVILCENFILGLCDTRFTSDFCYCLLRWCDDKTQTTFDVLKIGVKPGQILLGLQQLILEIQKLVLKSFNSHFFLRSEHTSTLPSLILSSSRISHPATLL